MKKIPFIKLEGTGNDFVLIDNRSLKLKTDLENLSRSICERKFGVGADGVLIAQTSKKALLKMRIFNSDGTEAEMCGNGARCFAFWAKSILKNTAQAITIETKAGIIESAVKNNKVKLKLTAPKDIALDLQLKINSRQICVNFINTGVPHAVCFINNLDEVNVKELGRLIRCHARFQPHGTNADFVEVVSSDTIKVRTYERGVEDETLACGTGSVAAAIISVLTYNLDGKNKNIIKVITKSGEILKIYFDYINGIVSDVHLEGRVKEVFRGEYYKDKTKK